MPLHGSVGGKINSPSCSCSQFPSAGLANRVLVYLVPLAWPWSILTLKPGLKPKPSPSPARAFNQGQALSFPEPEPCKAEPKPRLLSPAQPCKLLAITAAAAATAPVKHLPLLCMPHQHRSCGGSHAAFLHMHTKSHQHHLHHRHLALLSQQLDDKFQSSGTII